MPNTDLCNGEICCGRRAGGSSARLSVRDTRGSEPRRRPPGLPRVQAGNLPTQQKNKEVSNIKNYTKLHSIGSRVQ